MAYTNKELIAMMASDNPVDCLKAIEFLKQEMAVKINQLIKKMGGTGEDAEDALNEALAVAWQTAKEDRYKPNSKVKGYMYTVAKYYHHARTQNKPNFKSLEEYLLEIEDIVEKEEAVNEVYKKKLDKAMQLLSPVCQKILIEFYYHKKSMHGLMNEFSLGSEDAAKVKKHRCFKILKDLLK